MYTTNTRFVYNLYSFFLTFSFYHSIPPLSPSPISLPTTFTLPFHDNSSPSYTILQFWKISQTLPLSPRKYHLSSLVFSVVVVEDEMMVSTKSDSVFRFHCHHDIHFLFIFLQSKGYSPATHRVADFFSGYSSGFFQ
ncbi:unnamed protein product [Cuscuta epithymum]|uniref:Uncharacterized protein n=1 Tax=Cuscuta epithymum TaxID=186058 RepID=A0AAV0EHP3_9ASTE|nr:unnamed protein product [Cuscuta epithymum]